MNAEAAPVDATDLFSEVSEGDRILWGDRDEPVTVYRHVTEDDHAGQVITMKRVTEDHAEQNAWEVENGHSRNDALQAGDLMTGELTGDDFLIARGPRGGCYLLKQWWSKEGGRWTASIALYRRTRKDSEVWTWENTVHIRVVGSEDVDRDAFDEGGDWTRHTEVAGVTVWEDTVEGVPWAHSEDLTGVPPREPTDTGPEPWEVLETVSEGDVVRVNGEDAGTVTDIQDESDGALADGFTITLDDGAARLRTYTAKRKVAFMVPGGENAVVEDVEVSDG